MDWPLVGRTAELQEIAEALQNGRGVVVTAPAGMGKSRLVREAVDEAECV